jgi:hypothetical protein
MIVPFGIIPHSIISRIANTILNFINGMVLLEVIPYIVCLVIFREAQT